MTLKAVKYDIEIKREYVIKEIAVPELSLVINWQGIHISDRIFDRMQNGIDKEDIKLDNKTAQFLKLFKKNKERELQIVLDHGLNRD